jgi:hypothetical protein
MQSDVSEQRGLEGKERVKEDPTRLPRNEREMEREEKKKRR